MKGRKKGREQGCGHGEGLHLQDGGKVRSDHVQRGAGTSQSREDEREEKRSEILENCLVEGRLRALLGGLGCQGRSGKVG
jgi:hypothetical protein